LIIARPAPTEFSSPGWQKLGVAFVSAESVGRSSCEYGAFHTARSGKSGLASWGFDVAESSEDHRASRIAMEDNPISRCCSSRTAGMCGNWP